MNKRRHPARARRSLARRRRRSAFPLINTSRQYMSVVMEWTGAEGQPAALVAVLSYHSWEWQDQGLRRTPWTSAYHFITYGETADFTDGRNWEPPCVLAYVDGSAHDAPFLVGAQPTRIGKRWGQT